MPTYRRRSVYVMVLGTPENMTEINSWGFYPDPTMGDMSEMCIVYDIEQRMITDIITMAEFGRTYEERDESVAPARPVDTTEPPSSDTIE